MLKNGSRSLQSELQKYILKPTSPSLNAGTGLTAISKARNPEGESGIQEYSSAKAELESERGKG